MSYVAAAAGVTASLTSGTGTAGEALGDVLIGIENLIGSAYTDTLSGDAGANLLDGGAGNDSLSGGAGNDTLIGGAGADTLVGGDGFDLLSYATSTAGVTVLLSTGTAKGGHADGDVFSGIEHIIGSVFDDALIGSGVAELLEGGNGSDTLVGNGGGDTLWGGAGDDVLETSKVSVGYFDGGDGWDTLRLADQNAVVTGTTLNRLHNIEHIDLTAGNYQTLKLDTVTVASITGGVDNLFVTAGSTDTVNFAEPGWERVEDEAVGSIVYQVFLRDQSKVYVHRELHSNTLIAGSEVRVNSHTSSLQQNPEAARLADGGCVVIWRSQNQDGSGWGVYGQRYNAAGATVGGEFRVNSYTASNQYGPAVTALADGGFLVGWISEGQTGGTTGNAYGQRYDAAGQKVGAEFIIQPSLPAAYGHHDLALGELPDGSLVAVWSHANNTVMGRRFDAQGRPMGAEFQVGVIGSPSQGLPHLAMRPDGRFLVTWTTYGRDGGGAQEGVAARLYDASCTPLTGEFQVNVFTPNIQRFSRAAALEDGTYVITWTSFTQEGDAVNGGVYARRYGVNGQALTSEILVNSHVLDDQGGSYVTALEDGGFLIAWHSRGQDGSGYGVYAQRYNQSGQRMGSEFQVAETTADSQIWPTLVSRADGGFTAIWEQRGTTDSEISLRTFTYDHLMAPVVMTNDATVMVGTSIQAQILTAVGHPQGGEAVRNRFGSIVQYEFVDDTTAPGSGYFSVDGVRQAAGHSFLVGSAELSHVSFHAGSGAGTDTIKVRGFDGLRWSEWEDATVASLFVGNTITVGSEVRVNSHTSSLQQNPEAARLADGGCVVIWRSQNQDGSGWGVYGQRYNAAGATVGGEFRVNSYTASNQYGPAVTALADGGFLVGWISEGQTGGTTGNAYGQRYDAAGQKVGAEFIIQPSLPAAYGHHDLALGELPDGSLVAVWSHANNTVMGRRFDAQGRPMGAEFQVGVIGSPSQGLPHLAMRPDGRFLVTWTTYGRDGGGAQEGVAARLYDASCTPLTGEFQVNVFTPNIQRFSRAAALEDGTYVITWTSFGQDGSSAGVYARRYGANGQALTGEIQVNTYTLNDQAGSYVTALEDGGFLIAWHSGGQDGSGYGVYAQRYNQSGQRVGSEFQVAETTADSQIWPTLVSRADGGFTAIWEQRGTTDSEISLRVFKSSTIHGSIHGGIDSDVLVGGIGNDTLIGGGGQDTLTGGAGSDSFRYLSLADGLDTVADFQSGTDRIEFVHSAFSVLPIGQLDADRFALNAPSNADDRFVFNTETSLLSYDPDGSGAGAAIPIVTLNVGVLSASDIWVIASA
ncbi:MAG: hypothetical protein NVV74_08840 [Magnetospirillum sp.]|nr:hypothetical protein [Magnetospirillum sp.]